MKGIEPISELRAPVRWGYRYTLTRRKGRRLLIAHFAVTNPLPRTGVQAR